MDSASIEVKAKDELAKDSKAHLASLGQLFSTADWLDIFYMILGTSGGIITGLSLPYFNVLFGNMLDALNSGGSTSFSTLIVNISIKFIVVAVVNLFSGLFQVACWSASGERQAQRLREKYVRAILSQEIGWFDICGASELSTKVADLTGKVQDGIGRKVGDLIQYFAQFVGAFIVGFYLSWRLTVVLLAAFPLIAGAGAFMIYAITQAMTEGMSQYAAAGGLASEALGAIRTVTALNAQPTIINKYRAHLFQAMKVGITKGLNVGLGNGLLFGACFLTYALGFWYGGNLVAKGMDDHCMTNCVTGGSIMAVFFSVLMGSMALGQLAPPVTSFTSALAATYLLFEIIERVPLIDGLSTVGERPLQVIRGKIEIKDVDFAYPCRPDIWVCKNYNLVINAGETVALVGASGCGKSTIINMVLRFYDPQRGTVLLDDKNITSLNVRWLRSKIGYVGQEPVLFSGSVADNILYGIDQSVDQITQSPEDLRQRVISAAKLANAHDFISAFPQGYDTDVGSNGVAMSGGQKQRIAIARALIKQPAVLLLDEATSALDAASERLVQQSIDMLQQSKSQTTIVIAHRLSTIRNADKIAVVSEGVIKEMGRHDELMEQNGLYADLIRLQMNGGEEQLPDAEEGEEDPMFETEAETAAAGPTKTRSLRAESAGYVAAVTKTSATLIKTDKAAEPVVELNKEEASSLNRRIWNLVLKHPLWMMTGLLGAGAFGAMFPVWGLLLANSQHMFYLPTSDLIRQRAILLAEYYIGIAIVAVVSATLQFWGVAQVGERVSMKLRSDMFEGLLRRDISFYDAEENAVGTLTTRLSDDSRTIHKATGEALAKQLQAVFTLTIGLGIGLSASWRIALVVLAVFPVNIIASSIQMQAIAGQQYDKDGKDTSSSVIATAFTHMRTVSAFSMQFKIADEYAQKTMQVCEERASRSLMAGVGFGGSQMALFLTYALLFWYGSTLIENGNVNFKDMMTAILTLMLGALGLGQAMTDIGDQKSGLQAAKRIFQAIDESLVSPIDGLSTAGKEPETRARGRIELRKVTFAYPTRKSAEVCKDYNLVIEPGEVVALVGPSGSGKSTIMNLLLRFYDPLSGQVLLDGEDIKTLNVRWLRSQIGYVGQEPVLFSGSVSENIARGRVSEENAKLMGLEEAMKLSDSQDKWPCCGATTSGATATTKPYANLNTAAAEAESATTGDVEMAVNSDSDVISACKSSNAHDFISAFPQGYETDVGEGSIMVSGGQKQRIAIARALIKQPAVLLLDEATSALDAASERLVQQSIDMLQQSKSQTTIVIAHRLSTIRNADRIVVIDKGRVVESGTHDQLLALDNGLYGQLWAKQRGVVATGSNDKLTAHA